MSREHTVARATLPRMQGAIPLPIPGYPKAVVQLVVETSPEVARSTVASVQKVRCVAKRADGDGPCRAWAVKGGRYCVAHESVTSRHVADVNITAQYVEQIQRLVPKALARLEEIIDDGEDDKVSLAASKDLLDRAGLGAVHKSVHANVELPSGVSVDDRIEELLSGKVIDVP